MTPFKAYKGFKYKVSKFEVILAAKIKYSRIDEKHRNDVREMCGVKDGPKMKERAVNYDLPF